MKTLQEAFDTVAKHLLTQNSVSLHPYSSSKRKRCAYRGPDGLVCAIGKLIANEHYSEGLELKPATNLLVKEALEKSGQPTDSRSMSLYQGLQKVHDKQCPEKWRDGLKIVAQRFDLEWSIA